MATWLLLGFAVLTAPLSSSGQQQNFRAAPRDLQVLEGGEAMLRCEVSNLQGQVQWTKDGFALGFSAVIPGFPRYSVLGDRSQGVYNLRISNASIEDDAEYQCQVGPARFHKAVRANARLTVISPPSSIEIVGHAQHSKVEVRENQDLSLQCIVANSKPAAQIVWYRGNVELKPDSRKDETTEQPGKRFTVTSRLSLRPNADDDYTEYSCQAKHQALQPDLPMRATVQLSVLYPPGLPYIEGYTPGETTRRGQTVELVCRSRGGNPPAQLIWYKNGEQIRMAYRTAGRVSENIYTFTAEASDNKAKYRCEASNIMSNAPLKAEIDLSVLFAPSHVSISGPTEARVGDPVPLQCTTAPSNPPAEIKWMVAGKQIQNATGRTVVSPEGGWVTTSNITTIVEPHRRSLVVICHGLNMQLTENVVSTHTVNVLYPPSSPIITGYVEGSVIPAGSVQRLLCVSSGGNPLAALTWFKNDKKINAVVKTTDKSVTAELTILANVTDNQARYRCEAANSATEIPLFETTTLSVHFAPEVVKIRTDPVEWKPGMEATLVCDSSSSNPPARLSWWRDGIPVQGSSNMTKAGLHGGTVSSIELKLNVTQDMNGLVYTCQATNEALQRSVHESITLQVLFPPVFSSHSPIIVGVEGEALIATLSANANPESIVYTWTKDGLPIAQAGHGSGSDRIVSEGPILNITRLTRHDAGIFSCEAINSQGTAVSNVTIDVEYGATIKSVSENVIVEPNDNVTLSCTVQGNPLSEENIKWSREGYEMLTKTSTTFVNGTSYLHIKNAVREDVGNFKCSADNNIASPTSRDVLLIVKYKPEISQSPALLRAAVSAGGRGRVPCRASAAPRPRFSWSRNGQPLATNSTSKYYVEYRQLDPLLYESTLLVESVGASDYGSFECVARNELGFSTASVRLDVTSEPDPPVSLTVLNVTHDSVQLGWQPGFDGGMTPTYRIRYREISSETYRYEDVPATKSGQPLTHTISGLGLSTQYLFSIMAFNKLGHSKYLPDLVKAKTAIEAPPSNPSPSHSDSSSSSSGVLLLVGVGAGTVLVLLNVLVIGCCLHRRAKKRLTGVPDAIPDVLLDKADLPRLVIVGVALAALGLLLINAALVACYILRKRAREASGQSSKSATIEMYAPSSYNDTVTGETLSSVSEKSDSYSNEESQPDYMEENRKKTSAYISDGINMADIPPPRYQHTDNMTMKPVTHNSNMNANTRTLPHPRTQHNNIEAVRTRDDQSIGKGYLTAPSPAPPLDGSYYNMTSERYFSYPPMDYTPPLDYSHSPPVQPTSGTLRRTRMAHNAGVPPDVTVLHNQCGQPLHNSTPLTQMSHLPSSGNNLHYNHLNPLHNSNHQLLGIQSGNPLKQPHSILKDTSRKMHNPSPTNANLRDTGNQILSVQNTSLGSTGYDSTLSGPNLSTFTQPGSLNYPDNEGHLV